MTEPWDRGRGGGWDGWAPSAAAERPLRQHTQPRHQHEGDDAELGDVTAFRVPSRRRPDPSSFDPTLTALDPPYEDDVPGRRVDGVDSAHGVGEPADVDREAGFGGTPGLGHDGSRTRFGQDDGFGYDDRFDQAAGFDQATRPSTRAGGSKTPSVGSTWSRGRSPRAAGWTAVSISPSVRPRLRTCSRRPGRGWGRGTAPAVVARTRGPRRRCARRWVRPARSSSCWGWRCCCPCSSRRSSCRRSSSRRRRWRTRSSSVTGCWSAS